MKKYLAFLIFAGLSSCIDAQTVKETVRGKYGEDLGTAETTVRGGKSVTVYKDKYGQKTGTSTSTTSHGVFSSRTTSTTYRDKYGKKTGSSITKHSGNTGTTVYRDKYGQVTRKGTVRGRWPNRRSNYSYGWSSSKSRGK